VIIRIPEPERVLHCAQDKLCKQSFIVAILSGPSSSSYLKPFSLFNPNSKFYFTKFCKHIFMLTRKGNIQQQAIVREGQIYGINRLNVCKTKLLSPMIDTNPLFLFTFKI
jgi:hypothetical protein